MKIHQCPICKGFQPLPERFSKIVSCSECNAEGKTLAGWTAKTRGQEYAQEFRLKIQDAFKKMPVHILTKETDERGMRIPKGDAMSLLGGASVKGYSLRPDEIYCHFSVWCRDAAEKPMNIVGYQGPAGRIARMFVVRDFIGELEKYDYEDIRWIHRYVDTFGIEDLLR